MIAKAADGLGVAMHASLPGIVTDVNDQFIRIRKE